MTNILLLPFVTFNASTTTTGDWTDSIIFTNNGVPIDISGIAFSLDLSRAAVTSGPKAVSLSGSTSDGQLINGGPSGILQFNFAKLAMAGLPPDSYGGDLYASADGHTINLGEALGPSMITHRQGI